MTNWKTTLTGAIAWIAGVSAAFAADPTLGAYLAQLGQTRVVVILGVIAAVSGVLNSSLQRDRGVSDQQAGLRPEVKPEAQKRP